MEKTKVYFDASLEGSKRYREYYQKIVASLEKANCEVNQMVLKPVRRAYEPWNYKESRAIYKKILKGVSECDFLVAEMTYGSPSVAMVIQETIYRYKKPVLVLIHQSQEGRPGVAFIGHPSELLCIERYSTEGIDKTLKRFIKKVKFRIASTKFTVRLDKELDNYLAYKKLATGEVSKNQMILTILREQMGKDKEYQNFLEKKSDD